MENTCLDADRNVCADCGHEGSMAAPPPEIDDSDTALVKDANGQVLSGGDAVVLIKDLIWPAATMRSIARWTRAASC